MVTDYKKHISSRGSGLYVDHNNVLTYATKKGARGIGFMPRVRAFSATGPTNTKNHYHGYALGLDATVYSVDLDLVNGTYVSTATAHVNKQSLVACVLPNQAHVLVMKDKATTDEITAVFPDHRSYALQWDAQRLPDFDVVIDSDVKHIGISYAKPSSPSQVYIDIYEFDQNQPVFVKTTSTLSLFNFSLGLRKKITSSF